MRMQSKCLFSNRTTPILRLGSWFLVSFFVMGAIFASGCTFRQGRDYGHILFPSDPFFQVQVIEPNRGPGMSGLDLQDVLLLPPIGDTPVDVVREFPLIMWQELQQIIPGAVRMPRLDGAFSDYYQFDNVVADNGDINIEELIRIGMHANSSHVLLPVIITYRPYPPQKITMQWTLLDIREREIVLLLVGTLDASEQRVVIAADSFLRQRKAYPYNSDTLDVLLSSPHAFTGFALAEAVGALQQKLETKEQRVQFKSSAYMADIPVRE